MRFGGLDNRGFTVLYCSTNTATSVYFNKTLAGACGRPIQILFVVALLLLKRFSEKSVCYLQTCFWDWI